MNWPFYKLELLASDERYSFVGGPFGSKLTSKDYVDRGIPVIRGSNLNNGRFLSMDEFVFVSDAKAREDLFGNLAKPGDLVFTQRGTLGQVGLVPEEGGFEQYVVSQSQMKMTVDESKVDKLFLYYYFSSREAVKKIMSFTSSSGVPHINLTVLRNFEVPVPPLHIQKAIARTLSAYDDLIENNRRRIQLLEESARLLYKEWFVHLRFPGHEHVAIADGVPEGWEKKKAFDVMDVLSGGTPKTKIQEYWNGDIPFFTPKDAPEEMYVCDTIKQITEKGLNSCSSKLYPKNTIFITARGTVGKVKLAQRDMAVNQSCFALVSKPPLNQYFLYLALKENVEQFRSRAVGSVFDAIIRDTFKLIPFVMPSKALIEAFTDSIEPVVLQVENLIVQQSKLRQARDLLLPRLMNGEIAV